MVNHFRDTAYIESDTRDAARHRFHDGVGKIFFQRRGYEQIDRIIDIDQFFFVADVIQRIDLERYERFQLFGILAVDHDTQFVLQFRVLLGQKLAGFDEVVDAFPLVRNLGGTEKDELLVGRESRLDAGFLLVSWSEQVDVDGIRDMDDGMAGEQCTLTGSFFQPLATGNEGDGSGLVKLLLRLEYLVGKVLFVPSFI